jgi:hypothetical protein
MRRRQVREAGPDERRKALAWGAMVLVFVPLFDFIDQRIASAVIITVAVIGTVISRVYSRRRNAHVRPRSQRALGWFLWGLWYGALIFAAVLLQDSFSFAYTTAAILGALPLLAYGSGITWSSE